jgi:hypothetical protein
LLGPSSRNAIEIPLHAVRKDLTIAALEQFGGRTECHPIRVLRGDADIFRRPAHSDLNLTKSDVKVRCSKASKKPANIAGKAVFLSVFTPDSSMKWY